MGAHGCLKKKGSGTGGRTVISATLKVSFCRGSDTYGTFCSDRSAVFEDEWSDHFLLKVYNALTLPQYKSETSNQTGQMNSWASILSKNTLCSDNSRRVIGSLLEPSSRGQLWGLWIYLKTVSCPLCILVGCGSNWLCLCSIKEPKEESVAEKSRHEEELNASDDQTDKTKHQHLKSPKTRLRTNTPKVEDSQTERPADGLTKRLRTTLKSFLDHMLDEEPRSCSAQEWESSLVQ